MPFPLLELPPEIRSQILFEVIYFPFPIALVFFYKDDSIQQEDETSSPAKNQTSSYATTMNTIPIGLLYACTTLYNEARRVYWSRNVFSMVIQKDNSPLEHLFDHSFQDIRRLIRSLSITAPRWGTKTFFVDNIIPMLEDMILAGSLRDITVKVGRRAMISGLLDHASALWKKLHKVQIGYAHYSMQMKGHHVLGGTTYANVKDQQFLVANLNPEDLTVWKSSMIKRENMRLLVGILEDPYLEKVKLEMGSGILPHPTLHIDEDGLEIVDDITALLDLSRKSLGQRLI